MGEFKEAMMMCSEDYDELIDLALAKKDKEWFEKLVKKQKWLREMAFSVVFTTNDTEEGSK